MNNHNHIFMNNNLNQQINNNNNQLFMNNNLNFQMMNNNFTNHKINVKIISADQRIYSIISISPHALAFDLLKQIKEQYPYINIEKTYLICKGNMVHKFASLSANKIKNNDTILIFNFLLEENVNVDASIIVTNDNHPKFYLNNLYGLLRLCLLKEIGKKIKQNFQEKYSNKLSERIRYIMDILIYKNIPVGFNKTINSIMGVLKKLKGENIINFAKFIVDYLNNNDLNELINVLEDEIKQNAYKLINCLGVYNDYAKLFEEEFDKVKKDSIFDYRIVSLTIVDRKDVEKFEEEKKNCRNRKERILFHGTSIKPSGSILTDMFKKSEKEHYQFGKGVYFTDMLDYCWYYGGANSNRENLNKIPKIGETFTSVVSIIYYNQQGFKRVYDYKKDPKKNEINFALVDSETRTIKDENPDKKKFVGREYVINDLNQICPFIGCKLKRNEFCVVWRDVNFSPNPVYNNKYDETFKAFLKDRLDYMKLTSKFNFYPCETSEEALKIIERKKFNKIILISNVGNDLSGRQFVINARKIIGSEVVVLFLCYNINHLDWIKNFKNALFSNDASFYEEYLKCFMKEKEKDGYENEQEDHSDDSDSNDSKDEVDDQKIIEEITDLRNLVENTYRVKFNFDNKFLYYPKFKNEGKFSDLEL